MSSLSTTAFVDAGQLSNALNGAPVVITQAPAGTWNIVADGTTLAALKTAIELVSPTFSGETFATSVTAGTDFLSGTSHGLDTSAAGALAIGATNATSVVITPATTVTGVATFTALPVLPSGTLGVVRKAATVAASSGIANTDTVVAGPLTLVAAQTLAVGSKVRVHLNGTCTSSNADAGIFTIRAGTAGTTADASVATFTKTSAGSGSNIPFNLTLEFTVQTLGASGTAFGSAVLLNNGVTGISAAAVTVTAFTSSTLATTTATKLSVSYISGASTTTTTFQDVSIEVVP